MRSSALSKKGGTSRTAGTVSEKWVKDFEHFRVMHGIRVKPFAVIPADAGIHYGDMWNMDKQPAVYILASKRRGTLYVGVTSDLVKRIWEHKTDVIVGFTKRYEIHQLVWYESHTTMESAIEREKALKKWKRAWKLELIETNNPEWQDLYDTIL
jgi:putative endonuclease